MSKLTHKAILAAFPILVLSSFVACNKNEGKSNSSARVVSPRQALPAKAAGESAKLQTSSIVCPPLFEAIDNPKGVEKLDELKSEEGQWILIKKQQYMVTEVAKPSEESLKQLDAAGLKKVNEAIKQKSAISISVDLSKLDSKNIKAEAVAVETKVECSTLTGVDQKAKAEADKTNQVLHLQLPYALKAKDLSNLFTSQGTFNYNGEKQAMKHEINKQNENLSLEKMLEDSKKKAGLKISLIKDPTRQMRYRLQYEERSTLGIPLHDGKGGTFGLATRNIIQLEGTYELK